jgi:hypothetical protein
MDDIPIAITYVFHRDLTSVGVPAPSVVIR